MNIRLHFQAQEPGERGGEDSIKMTVTIEDPSSRETMVFQLHPEFNLKGRSGQEYPLIKTLANRLIEISSIETILPTCRTSDSHGYNGHGHEC